MPLRVLPAYWYRLLKGQLCLQSPHNTPVPRSLSLFIITAVETLQRIADAMISTKQKNAVPSNRAERLAEIIGSRQIRYAQAACCILHTLESR